MLRSVCTGDTNGKSAQYANHSYAYKLMALKDRMLNFSRIEDALIARLLSMHLAAVYLIMDSEVSPRYLKYALGYILSLFTA